MQGTHRGAQSLTGVIPILPTPFNERGEVEESDFARAIEASLADGVDGVAMFGVASEAYKLTDDHPIAELHREQFAGPGGIYGAASAGGHAPRSERRDADGIAEQSVCEALQAIAGRRRRGADAASQDPASSEFHDAVHRNADCRRKGTSCAQGNHSKRDMPESRVDNRCIPESGVGTVCDGTGRMAGGTFARGGIDRVACNTERFQAHITPVAGRLAGKVALITGGAKGIGKAIGLRFAQEGADVAITDKDENAGLETVEELRGLGRRGVFARADVADRGAVEDMVQRALREFGAIDILVNNAGIIVFGSLMQCRLEDWDRMLAVDLTGSFHCAQVVGEQMVKRGRGGRMIHIGSTAALLPTAEQ